jgi:hypothetical protein
VYVCRVDVARDDVEAGDVARGFGGGGGDEAVLGLEEAAHNIEGGGFSD